jgi:hypothetical protein
MDDLGRKRSAQARELRPSCADVLIEIGKEPGEWASVWWCLDSANRASGLRYLPARVARWLCFLRVSEAEDETSFGEKSTQRGEYREKLRRRRDEKVTLFGGGVSTFRVLRSATDMGG